MASCAPLAHDQGVKRLLFACFLLVGCGGESGATVAATDSGGGDAPASETSDDTGAEDSELPQFDASSETTASDSAMPSDASDGGSDGKLSCTGSQIEPNDSLASARLLTGIDDCDGSGSTFKGTVGGADVDFWTYKGKDKFGCTVDPTVNNKSASVRVCVFAQCASGATEFKKCSKGTATKLPSGLDGCCTDGPGEASLDYTCTLVGTDDSADVFMRVDSPGATTCLPYEVDYHF
jgi:hypothetical protein